MPDPEYPDPKYPDPEYDDYELNPGSRSEEPEFQNQSWSPMESSSEDGEGAKRVLVLVLIVAVLLGLGGAWWWWSSFKQAAGVDEPAATTAAARPDPEPAAADVDDADLPDAVSLGESDALLRELVSTVSSHPRLAAWLVNDGLIDRFVKVSTNVAYGEDPKSHVPFMRPGRDFDATARGEARIISARSFARYSPYIEVLESLDTEGTAELYRRFEPAMEEAFAELGYPGTFKQTLDQAVQRILAVPVPEGDLEVQQGVLSYKFADPQLENASDLDKLLFRMGPDNQRRLRSEVRRLASAIGTESAD